jgi:cephalosporin-C deacetylase-like acetyl esterase
MNKLHFIEIAGIILIATAFFSYISLSGGWYSAPQPIVTTFNTTFWDLNQNYPPLNLTSSYRGNSTIGGNLLAIDDIWFDSHFYNNGSIVRIHSIFVEPYTPNAPPTAKIPGVLLLHGTNGSAEEMLGYGEQLASNGYAVLAMDSPGCGNSTGPKCTDANNVDFSNGPYSSYYYQNVIAASRAITVLAQLNDVNGSAIAVTGASMGGVTTFLISAIDNRVKVAIPVVAAGYFDDIIQEGSFANFVIPLNVSTSDPRVKDFGMYFDCRAYAEELKVPTLMLIGTNDEFFFLEAVNKTYSIIPSEKALNLIPNLGHAFAEDWINSTVLWLDHYLKGTGQTLPTQAVPSAEVINFYTAVNVSVLLSNNYSTSLFYRYSIPGALWAEVNLSQGENVPLLPIPTNIEYYTATEVNGTILSTSPVYQIQATSSYFFLLVIFLVLVIIVLAANLRADISAYISSDVRGSILFALGIIIWFVAAMSITLPWVEIPGRATMSLMQLWDRYAVDMLPVYVLFIGLLIALAGFAIRMWIGGLVLAVTAIGLYLWLTPLVNVSGGYFIFAWGAFVMGACFAIALVIPALIKIVRA